MIDKFNPSANAVPMLETVYTSKESKDWIKKQSQIHGVTMVTVIDEMVAFCDKNKLVKRPNVLRPDGEK